MQIVHWEYENKQATSVQPCVSCDLYADLTSDQKYQKLINPFQKNIIEIKEILNIWT